MAYVLLFAGFVVAPNFRTAPSLLLVAAAVLAALWLVGCLGLISGIPRSDELALCGAASPVVLGLAQLVYRVNFLRLQGFAGTDQSGSPTAFALVWAAEVLLVLLPGLGFLWWNSRRLAEVPDDHQPKRPSASSRRT